MMHRIKSRLRRAGGFSLAETLIAILILLMVTSIVIYAIPAAQRAYVKLTDSANAQMLMSTTMTRLRDELGTATNVKVADGVITYTVANGSQSRIWYETPSGGSGGGESRPGGIYLRQYDNLHSDSSDTERLLVSKLTGGEDIYMVYGSAVYDPDKGLFTFSDLEVLKNGNVLSRIDTFQIRVLTAS